MEGPEDVRAVGVLAASESEAALLRQALLEAAEAQVEREIASGERPPIGYASLVARPGEDPLDRGVPVRAGGSYADYPPNPTVPILHVLDQMPPAMRDAVLRTVERAAHELSHQVLVERGDGVDVVEIRKVY